MCSGVFFGGGRHDLPGLEIKTAKGYTLLQDAIAKGNLGELQVQLSLLSREEKKVAANSCFKFAAIESIAKNERDTEYEGNTPVEMVLTELRINPFFSADQASFFLFELFQAGAEPTEEPNRKNLLERLKESKRTDLQCVQDMLERYLPSHLLIG